MERPLGFAMLSGLAGALSFSTLLLPRDGALAHMAQNATWALVVGAVILALLATDGAKDARVKTFLVAGIALAGLRAILIFGLGA